MVKFSPTKTIYLDADFQSLIPPLSTEEYSMLEQSLLSEGCREALTIWSNNENLTLIDGHNRHSICTKNNIPFQIIKKEFSHREDVIEWILLNQLGRRNLTDLSRTDLVGRLYKSRKKQHGAETGGRGNQYTEVVSLHFEDLPEKISTEEKDNRIFKDYWEEKKTPKTAEVIAEEQKVSKATVERAEKFVDAIDTITENCGQEVKNKILSKDIRMTQKEVIQLSKVAPEKQKEIIKKVEEGEARNINFAIYEFKREEVKEEISNRVKDLKVSEKILNLDIVEGLKEISSKVDLAIADPPYFLTEKQKSGYQVGKGDWDERPSDYDCITQFNMDWLEALMPVLSDKGSLLIFGTVHNIYNIGYCLHKLGYYIIQSLVWHKPFLQKQINRHRFAHSHELIIWARHGDNHIFNSGEVLRDIIKVQPQSLYKHDCEKPEKLIEFFIEHLSNPDSIILDLFAGSGVTSASAKKLGRNFIAIESDKYWCKVITERVDKIVF